MSPSSLVTGASGYLGGLVAAALLARGRRLVMPLRAGSDAGACLARVRAALLDLGVPEPDAGELMRLASLVELPPLDRFGELDAAALAGGVDEIVHCAGCVDYFDEKRLQAANVDLTRALLDSGRRWSVRRFLYLSTAYCSGYRTASIPEALHPDPAPAGEPTDYTRSKRIAERHIAGSGLPFLIVRPSVVVGDSRTGKYTGKNYGLYQMWRAIEGLLCREYAPVWYTVAPPAPVNFVHQDAFQAGFMAIYGGVPPDGIVHLVSRDATSPTMREMAWLWADVYAPLEIHSYARVDDVPLRSLPVRQRRFLELAHKNIEIASQTWRFETGHLDRLRADGLHFADATLETVARCQRQYISGSARIQQHMRQYAGRPGSATRLVERF